MFKLVASFSDNDREADPVISFIEIMKKTFLFSVFGRKFLEYERD